MTHGRPRRPHGEASGDEGSIDRYTGWSGEGDGAVPTPLSVEGPKAMMVDAWVQSPDDGATGHHDDRDDGGVGR
jgi:hypothetical protein